MFVCMYLDLMVDTVALSYTQQQIEYYSLSWHIGAQSSCSISLLFGLTKSLRSTMTMSSESMLVPRVKFKLPSCFIEKSPGKYLALDFSSSSSIPRILKALATSSEQKNVLSAAINLYSPFSSTPMSALFTVLERVSLSALIPYLWPTAWLKNFSRLSTI